MERDLDLQDGCVKDAMTYDAHMLLEWKVLLVTKFSVWGLFTHWAAVGRLLVFAGFIAMLNLVLSDNVKELRQRDFYNVASPMKFCIGILMGFFLSVSVNRWWAVVDAFQSLADSLCDLQKDLCCFGVPQEKSKEILRLGVLSAWILHFQMIVAEATSEELDQIHVRLLKFGLFNGYDSMFAAPSQYEIDMLCKVDDPSCALWTWFGSLLGRLSEDGWVPPMTTPAYGNLLAHSSEAHQAIRSIKTHTICQAPFIYVHMLACLIHLNNILCAVSLGTSVAVTLSRRLQPESEPPDVDEVVHEWQDVIYSFFFCLFGPLVYQALFEVAIAMTQSFRQAGAPIPTEGILKHMERDLQDGFRAIHLTQWERPRFKLGQPPSPPASSPPSDDEGDSDRAPLKRRGTTN